MPVIFIKFTSRTSSSSLKSVPLSVSVLFGGENRTLMKQGVETVTGSLNSRARRRVLIKRQSLPQRQRAPYRSVSARAMRVWGRGPAALFRGLQGWPGSRMLAIYICYLCPAVKRKHRSYYEGETWVNDDEDDTLRSRICCRKVGVASQEWVGD